ncbi:MAG: carcinine hydrolase/isopenicillin-N N-acyltransferase family protein [Candidatus Hodarchaeota archaeon]
MTTKVPLIRTPSDNLVTTVMAGFEDVRKKAGKMAIQRRKYWLAIAALLTILGPTMESASACSILTASSGDKVLFGYNEDQNDLEGNPMQDLQLFFAPENISYYHEAVETYGHMLIVRETEQWTSPRVGMNMEGLAISGNGLRDFSTPMNSHPERFYGSVNDNNRYSLYNKILEECSNVSEAINLAQKFDYAPSMPYQIHIADAAGDAVVIGPGPDGELGFTRKGSSSYLVSTNFPLANPQTSDYPCPRYEKAEARLQKIEREDDLTVDYIRSILDAIHYEGFETNTAYSQIFDLKNRMAYLYYWHQYGEVVTLNLTEELAKGIHKVPLQDLFSQETLDDASHEYQTYQTIALGVIIFVLLAGVVVVAFLGVRIWKTVKNVNFTTKRKALQTTALIIGGLLVLSFLRNFGVAFPYLVAGNYLSNSHTIQMALQEFIIAYLVIGGCAAAILVGYLLLARRSISTKYLQDSHDYEPI